MTSAPCITSICVFCQQRLYKVRMLGAPHFDQQAYVPCPAVIPTMCALCRHSEWVIGRNYVRALMFWLFIILIFLGVELCCGSYWMLARSVGLISSLFFYIIVLFVFFYARFFPLPNANASIVWRAVEPDILPSDIMCVYAGRIINSRLWIIVVKLWMCSIYRAHTHTHTTYARTHARTHAHHHQ